jgi:hypothetical protein
MPILAGQHGVQIGPPLLQGRSFVENRAGPVGKIVGQAHECVQGAHGPPLCSRQDLEGGIEMHSLAPGESFTIGV